MKGRIEEVPEAEEVLLEFREFEWGGARRMNRKYAGQFLRKLKYNLLLWHVVKEGDIIYDLDLKIISTKPKGEVQITPKTTIKLTESRVGSKISERALTSSSPLSSPGISTSVEGFLNIKLDNEKSGDKVLICGTSV